MILFTKTIYLLLWIHFNRILIAIPFQKHPLESGVWVKQRPYSPLVSTAEMAIFGKLSWPNLTFLTPHLAQHGSPSPSLVCFSPTLACSPLTVAGGK